MRTTISCSYAHPLSFINSCSPRLTGILLYPKVGTQRPLLIKDAAAADSKGTGFLPLPTALYPYKQRSFTPIPYVLATVRDGRRNFQRLEE